MLNGKRMLSFPNSERKKIALSNSKYVMIPKFIEVDANDSTNSISTTKVFQENNITIDENEDLDENASQYSSESLIDSVDNIEQTNKTHLCAKPGSEREYGRKTIKALPCNNTSEISLLNDKLVADDAFFEFLVIIIVIFFLSIL